MDGPQEYIMPSAANSWQRHKTIKLIRA